MEAGSSARAMVGAVARREVSARELLELHLQRIEERNGDRDGGVNAIVGLDVERAREGAAVADAHQASGAPLGPLHGLPFAVKDTHRLAGWRTTFGSPLFADHVPDVDDLPVERVRRAGVVLLGRTNTPELAAGSHTFNEVHGTTRNPADLTRSAGGSSGGAAAALAAGMVPLADGSDMGGSLRNPASFCGVVGLRPSLGRVPMWPVANQWEVTATHGPLARTVDDVALLLGVQAGPDPRVPLALGEPGHLLGAPLPLGSRALRGLRVAWSLDLGRLFPVDDAVARVVEDAGRLMARNGAKVFAAAPDLREADATFRTLRAWHLHAGYGELLARHPSGIKPVLAENIRAGALLTGRDVDRAYRARTELGERMRLFFADYDVLALPAAQVPPFPVDQEYPAEVAGERVRDYLDWMRAAYLVTVTGCPAISVPAGTTPEGWPVGVQLVAPHGADRRLLEVAAAFEAVSGGAQDS